MIETNDKDTTNGGHFAEFSHFVDRLKELVYPKATQDNPGYKPIYDQPEAASAPEGSFLFFIQEGATMHLHGV